MSQWTKATRITWDIEDGLFTPFGHAREDIIETMVERGITDGLAYPSDVPGMPGTRHWLNQTAAEEWRDTVKELGKQYNREMISCEIIDI